ncbi:MAG: PorP/SprF family type IX secretion system membrane protein [Reichenbachiella sp.]|uniref:PorP/SprF family type IX secretion system membrane protein n=1 Tax=Reichenbachiella sp. TaxID=2184521 RepID=UPI003297FCAA
MRAILILLVVFGLGWSAQAQQTPLFSQYYVNPYLLNPAFAGSDIQARAFLTYRKQWTGIPGAPETQAFSIDGALNNENMGLGIILFNDITNILGRLNLMGSYSYKIDLSEQQHLTLGASLGVLQNRIYFDRINSDSPDDPTLLNDVDNKSVLDGNIGIKYGYNKLLFGFAVTQLFQNEINHENAADFKTLDFSLIRHYTTTIQYDFDLGRSFTLTPIVLMRVAQGLSPQFDISANINYQSKLWAGVAYRTQIGTNFSMGFAIDDKFIVGYSYEVPTKKIRELGKGSHEFTIGLRLNKIGGGKSTAAQETNFSPIYTSDHHLANQEKYDALEQKNRQLKEEVEEQSKELALVRSMMQEHRKELEQLIKSSAVDLESNETFDPDHEYYLVIGATRDFQEAKTFQRMIKRETDTESRITQNAKKTWYLIYSGTLHSPEEAQNKIKALNENKVHDYIVGTPWVYQSQD